MIVVLLRLIVLSKEAVPFYQQAVNLSSWNFRKFYRVKYSREFDLNPCFATADHVTLYNAKAFSSISFHSSMKNDVSVGVELTCKIWLCQRKARLVIGL